MDTERRVTDLLGIRGIKELKGPIVLEVKPLIFAKGRDRVGDAHNLSRSEVLGAGTAGTKNKLKLASFQSLTH